MSTQQSTSDFFHVGGTLSFNSLSYVHRPADDELFKLVSTGKFCYVLTARQMGKSSLMVRTARRLQEQGIFAAIIDLTAIGSVPVDTWYLGLLAEITHQLHLSADLENWWNKHTWLGPVHRFITFLRHVVLMEIKDQVVIFIDEIDTTLKLDFSNDFFTAIRAMYNARATDPEFNRLTFVLLGVASPSDLIKDKNQTPFNIGQGIALKDFSYADAVVLQTRLEMTHPGQSEAIFKRIYHWTNGHPYLTQKLCQVVAETGKHSWTDEQVDELVEQLFLSEHARQETNLQFVQDRIKASSHRRDLLTLYRRIYQGERVSEDEQSFEQNRLKLYGLVRAEQGILRIRNEIYHRVFNLDWIKANIPSDSTSRKANRTALFNLGNLYFDKRDWAEAYAAYARAIEADEELLASISTQADYQLEMGETSRLYNQAAYCLLKLAKSNEALVQLEQGKTRLTAKVLTLNDADLARLPVAAQKALRDARRTVHELEGELRLPRDMPMRRSEVELGQLLEHAQIELNRLVADIRSEHPHFLPTGLDLLDILALAPSDGALIIPLITSHGGVVFIIPEGADTVKAEHIIWLDTFTEDMINTLFAGSEDKLGWLHTYLGYRDKDLYYRDKDAFNQWLTTIESITGQLWELLMRPIHERLMTLGLRKGDPVVLIPYGDLGMLPLHAVWREVSGVKYTFLDDYIVSYVSSIYLLDVCYQRLQDERRHHPCLLAVVDPTGDLTYTRIEGEAISVLFSPHETRLLEGDQATSEAVIQIAPIYTYLHFACHGFYDWQDVMQSGLLLANHPPLTLKEIISKLDLSSTRLVVCSTDETKPREFRRLPVEHIGLAAGFLQAGAPGVISTLWVVDDLAAALLLERFYYHHLNDTLSPVAALRQAQLWLRELTLGEVLMSLKRQNASVLTSDPFLYTQLEQTRRKLLAQHGSDETARPFAHPYYWAAFTFTGS